MVIVVTGACGFIGSNLVKALNEQGVTHIIAVDDLSQNNHHNLLDCEVSRCVDKHDFMEQLLRGELDGKLRAIMHQGACVNTVNYNKRYMMDNNFQYLLSLLNYSQRRHVPLIYASSAAVYGNGTIFKEERQYEDPLNVYSYSKLLLDQVLRWRMQYHGLTAQVVGLRYFNVYGPREQHKGQMASVVFQHFSQYRTLGKVKLFAGWDGCGDGMQSRDFISVEDIVKVNLFFLDHPEKMGIFNVGTGCARSFNSIAHATVNAYRRYEGQPELTLAEMVKQGIIEYIPFPEQLKGKYQSFTQANMDALRGIGYLANFLTVEHGISRYVGWLLNR